HVSSFLCSSPPAPTAISTLSLHDALPILASSYPAPRSAAVRIKGSTKHALSPMAPTGTQASPAGQTGSPDGSVPFITEERHFARSEEHTSELQSRENLVCRLLLEKKKNEA